MNHHLSLKTNATLDSCLSMHDGVGQNDALREAFVAWRLLGDRWYSLLQRLEQGYAADADETVEQLRVLEDKLNQVADSYAELLQNTPQLYSKGRRKE